PCRGSITAVEILTECNGFPCVYPALARRLRWGICGGATGNQKLMSNPFKRRVKKLPRESTRPGGPPCLMKVAQDAILRIRQGWTEAQDNILRHIFRGVHPALRATIHDENGGSAARVRDQRGLVVFDRPPAPGPRPLFSEEDLCGTPSL